MGIKQEIGATVVWLRAKLVVLPNVKIEKGSVIGAGGVVSKDIKTLSIAAGVPAKKIGTRGSK
jgi:acetyltransferase-like isoleucine patch superfamily enzyme